MAELTTFGFRSQVSFLHALDPRFKLASFVMIGLACLKSQPPALGLISCFLIILFGKTRFPRDFFSKGSEIFLIFMAGIIITRALFTPGNEALKTAWFSVSRQGIYDGVVISWRLLLIIFSSLLFISSTRASEIKTAVQWFLKPIPFVPEKRVATMMSLIVRFIPMILNQIKETSAAQKARGVENRRNPVYRFSILILPVIRRTFETGDRLAIAMEARCYTENRTDPGLSAKRSDWFALSTVLIVCLSAVLVPAYVM